MVDMFPNLTGFTRLLFGTYPPDNSNRFCMVEQDGLVHITPNNPSVTSARVMLDIRSRVQSIDGERGLLSLAFDPSFIQNRHFYICYTTPSPSEVVVARYTMSNDPDVADPTSERILLRVPKQSTIHNGGMLAFGPDGMLYVSVGDDAHMHTAQDLTTLTGKILRINPNTRTGSLEYGIPNDNPFVGVGGGAREEIYAYGLRNPWRFSFDRLTGDLWVGDVGHDFEEINVVESGDNCGWPIYDGRTPYQNPNNLPPTAFKMPIRDYRNGGPDGVAVIGGYVYRGNLLPELRGAYIHGDWISRKNWAMVTRGGTITQNPVISTSSGMVSYAEDASGEVYAIDRYNVLRFQRRGSTTPPPFPTRLSETGAFKDLATLQPAVGLLEYTVNAPLWSDGAEKRRWIYAPHGTIGFHATDAWSFPVGTVIIKHFEIQTQVGNPLSMRRLETRFMVHETGGWAGYTYRWNSQQTDADLLVDGLDETLTILDPQAPGGQRNQVWQYPAQAQCISCHTPQAGHVLGVRTGQLNRVHTYPNGTRRNLLDHWSALGLFTQRPQPAHSQVAYADPEDTTKSFHERARAYMASNCSHCHLPSGPGRTQLDLRHDTPELQMNAVDQRPILGGLGLSDPYIVRKSDKSNSVLWERMRRTDSHRMPRIGSTLPDPGAIQLIGDWIDSLR